MKNAVQNTLAGMDPPRREAEPPSYEEVSHGYEPMVEDGVIGRRVFNPVVDEPDDAGASAIAVTSSIPDMPASSATAIGKLPVGFGNVALILKIWQKMLPVPCANFCSAVWLILYM